MKKYLYGFKIYFLNSLNYRFNTFVNLIFANLNLLITIIFWILIYESNDSLIINGFSMFDMITYFLLGGIIRRFILSSSGFSYSYLIKSGRLSSMLLKPYSVNISIYFNNLSNIITDMIPQILAVILLLPFIYKYLGLELNIVRILFIFMFIIIATISSHFTWSILGYMAFWLEEANALMWSFAVFFNFMTGMFIPLDFFPTKFLNILEWLPFFGWSYIPIKILLNHYSMNEIILKFLVSIGWSVIMYIIMKIVWFKGVKKYTSTGE